MRALFLLLVLPAACVRLGFDATPSAGDGGGTSADSDADASAPPGVLVLGQTSFTRNDNLAHGFHFPWGVATDGKHLVVADTNDNRVLVWDTLDAKLGAPGMVVLGQPTLFTSSPNHGGLDRGALRAPTGVAIEGGVVAVADTDNHRVLIWSSIPGQSGQSADVVLGDPAQAKATAASFTWPGHVSVAAGRLLVADTGNNRVLIWNAIPTKDGTPADVVLGQPSMTTSGLNKRSAWSLAEPGAVATDGTRLAVADSGNNRVLIWRSFPTANAAEADLVLGQKDFTSASSTAVNGASLSGPGGVALWGGRVVVSDTGNHRLLVWSSVPTQNGAGADLVLGQQSTTASSPNRGGDVSGGGLSTPRGMAAAGDSLFVVDYDNSRVLRWSAATLQTAAPAEAALGQPSLTQGCPKGSHVTASTLFAPEMVWTDGQTLLVPDLYAHRVLLWSPVPTSSGAAAGTVIGQPDPGACRSTAPTTRSLQHPFGVHSDGKRLFVADSANHRVLIWNTLPSGAAAGPADVVLGQPDMTTNTPSSKASATGLLWPSHLCTDDGGRLYVVDFHNRVLIWSSVPTASQAPADLVLGQPDLTSGSPNAGGLSARSLHEPNDVWVDGSRVFVSDSTNDRVLIWNSLPQSSFAPADVVVGQPDMTTGSERPASARTLFIPRGLHAASGKLVVADSSNHRVLVWDTIPTADYQPADRVLGQPDMTSATPNNGGLHEDALYYPNDVFYDGARLHVADSWNDRVLIVPLDVN